jgi:glutathione synthase/RimK-type ligase-like ATP-grasp enzyme
MLPRIAYVTHAGKADPDPDLPLAVDAFERAGLEALPVAWDAEVDWADFDLAVVRSPWDHYDRRQAFLRWARAAEDRTLLANPAVTLARNTDKTYLRDLARQGIPVVDTLWVEPGDDLTQSAALIERRGWSHCVVKPNVGGAARHIHLVEGPVAAAAAAADLVARGWVAMIQPYLDVVEQDAEVSVMIIGGQVSHAVSRVPPLTAGGTGQARAAVPVTDELAETADDVMRLAAAGEELLYARVDLVPDEDQWLLMEFEATEPCLFLDRDGRAADALAWAARELVTADAQEADYLAGSG